VLAPYQGCGDGFLVGQHEVVAGQLLHQEGPQLTAAGAVHVHATLAGRGAEEGRAALMEEHLSGATCKARHLAGSSAKIKARRLCHKMQAATRSLQAKALESGTDQMDVGHSGPKSTLQEFDRFSWQATTVGWTRGESTYSCQRLWHIHVPWFDKAVLSLPSTPAPSNALVLGQAFTHIGQKDL
jgi:hypothetical protein